MALRLLLFFLALGPFCRWADAMAAETGAFFVREYSPKTYGAGTQNWAVVQDKRGVIYAANNDGILEFDGQRWRKLSLPNSICVRSLVIDQQGTIYVGAQTDFGFLKANGTGTLEYVSLLDKLRPEDRVFNDVWTTLATSSGIVFSSYQRIFRWSPQHGMETWKPVSVFSMAFLADDTPYVVDEGIGLCRLVRDSLQRVPGGEAFAHKTPLHGVFRFMGSLMVATPDTLYLQKDGKFEKVHTQADALLREGRIRMCLPLEEGRLALATSRRGVIVLDPQGSMEQRLDSGTLGLHSSSINNLYRDREGGLWLALNNGLARVDMSGFVSRFTEHEGLNEIVNAIQRQDGVLYAGTMEGLFRLTTENGAARFKPVTGVYGQILSLATTHDGLLAGGSGKLWQINENGLRLIDLSGAVLDVTVSATNPQIAYAAGNNGLSVLQWSDGRWQQTQHFNLSDHEFLSVAEEAEHLVWATTHSEVWRIDFRNTPLKMERFAKQQGVSGGWKRVHRIHHSILLTTEQGALRFDARLGKFVPDTLLGSQQSGGTRPVSTVFQTRANEIWVTGSGYHGVLRATKQDVYTWNENVLGNFGIKEIAALYADDDGTLWAAGKDGGLIRYQPSANRQHRPELQALVRQAQIVGQQQPVFGGAEAQPIAPRFRYQKDGIHFDFAAPLFEGSSEVEFRVRLEGLSPHWSPWMTQPGKEYTNLWEGHYLLHVQARDATGRLSQEGAFAFRVLPPLYRQWWAYLLYAASLAGIGWLFLRWRLVAVQAQNRKLELLVHERTEEVRQQHDALKAQQEETETLLLNVLPAPIAKELRATGAVTPMLYENVTVCFTDFVGFTVSTEAMPPDELVAALSRYFTEFDKIIGRYGLEKVKTIGDSYMFIGGSPTTQSFHAVNAVLAALEIIEVVERLGQSAPGWKIRVGLHSGPVVAGVVGCRKFAFDVWGRTVNFASRHESSCPPNRVNISAQTYHLIRDFFQCEPRGQVRIKEGRDLDMYLVRCVHPELCGPGLFREGRSFEDLYQQQFGIAPPVSSFPNKFFLSTNAG